MRGESGLQNLHPRFKSGRRLQNSLAKTQIAAASGAPGRPKTPRKKLIYSLRGWEDWPAQKPRLKMLRPEIKLKELRRCLPLKRFYVLADPSFVQAAPNSQLAGRVLTPARCGLHKQSAQFEDHRIK
jgi:hypothetical protein